MCSIHGRYSKEVPTNTRLSSCKKDTSVFACSCKTRVIDGCWSTTGTYAGKTKEKAQTQTTRTLTADEDLSIRVRSPVSHTCRIDSVLAKLGFDKFLCYYDSTTILFLFGGFFSIVGQYPLFCGPSISHRIVVKHNTSTCVVDNIRYHHEDFESCSFGLVGRKIACFLDPSDC